MPSSPRGFPESEYSRRVLKAQKLMEKAGIAALLLTTEPEIRYFSGFLTRFWESPSRPWSLIVPASGKPIAVIPEIGRYLMEQTWLDDIRTWPSPDYEDDGVGLICETIREISPGPGIVGIPSGRETHLRLPLDSWNKIVRSLPAIKFESDAGLVAELRLIKSPREVSKIETACGIANRAFGRVREIAAQGENLDRVFQKFQGLCLEEGADWVAYLAGAAGQGGYGDVISPATSCPLQVGDVLMLDTGAVHDGYFCDFNRNFSVGPADAEVQNAHSVLIDATYSAFECAKPGATFADLFRTMTDVLNDGIHSYPGGRLGHGLGLQLTEGPSILAEDHTVLNEGLVLTLEPCVQLANGKIMVHEENVVITKTGARFLSEAAPGQIPLLEPNT